jgi:apolipoprotein N-acyltransferase
MGAAGIPAVIGLAILMTFFMLPILTLLIPFKKRTITAFRLIFAVSFALTEWLRGNLCTGFPWNLPGSMWGTLTYSGDYFLSILSATAWIGIYGLSFLTLLAASFIFASRLSALMVALGFGLLSALGSLHLSSHPTVLTGINLRLIQPSIPQTQKWVAAHMENNVNLQLSLSGLAAERPLKAILWAEAAVPYLLAQSLELVDAMASLTPTNGYMITGGPRKEGEQVYNSLHVISHDGKILQSYDKEHLLPFGEYMPLKRFIPFEKMSDGSVDFSFGKGIETLHLDGLPPFSPLICFEAVFPGKVVGTNRPEWLLNVTNDAWFGLTSGPYQHLALVRIRSIEEGLPLVRVANNGVSAVIDANGRILHRLGLDDIGFIDFDLPRYNSPTLYSHYKETPFFTMLIIGLVISIVMGRRKRLQDL